MSTNRDGNEFIAGKKEYACGTQLGTFTQIINRKVPNARPHNNVGIQTKRFDVEEDLTNSALRAIAIKKQQEEKNERERRNAQKEEELRLEREKQEQKKKNYDSLMEQAKKCYLEDKFNESQEAARAALAIFNNEEVVKLLSDIERGIQNQNERIAREEEKKNALSRPFKEVLAGKTSVGNIFGTAKNWVKENGNNLSDEEYIIIVEALKQLPPKELRKLPSKISQLKQIADDSLVNRLLTEFGFTNNSKR